MLIMRIILNPFFLLFNESAMYVALNSCPCNKKMKVREVRWNGVCQPPASVTRKQLFNDRAFGKYLDDKDGKKTKEKNIYRALKA